MERSISLKPSHISYLSPSNGRAGEYYLLYRLLTWGYPAIPVTDGSSYDILIPFQGRFCRIQVKALSRPNPSGSWQFQTFQGKWSSVRRPYPDGAFDIIAYAALGLGKCLFRYGVPQTATVYLKGTVFDQEEPSWLQSWGEWIFESGQ